MSLLGRLVVALRIPDIMDMGLNIPFNVTNIARRVYGDTWLTIWSSKFFALHLVGTIVVRLGSSVEAIHGDQ